MATLARWQATIVDESGNVVPLASIEVRSDVPGQPLASLFSDRDGAVGIANPFTAASDGLAAFHVTGGAYKITASLGGFSRTWRYVGIGLGSEFDFAPAADYQEFDTPGTFTWTKPAHGLVAFIQCWGGGGSGGRAGTTDAGGGGGGGSYAEQFVPLDNLSDTETVTVGIGGAAATANDQNGAVGGKTQFGVGDIVSGHGGGGGCGVTTNAGGGGGGGGLFATGSNSTSINGAGGGFPSGNIIDPATPTYAWGDGGIGAAAGASGASNPFGGGGGGGGGGSTTTGGDGGQTEWGGGGGGGGGVTTGGDGGSSTFGGSGGGGGGVVTKGTGGFSFYGADGGDGAIGANNATAGDAGGGGGGGSVTGNSGAGGGGFCIVTVF